jgi:A/G-specific adenine glycosylase
MNFSTVLLSWYDQNKRDLPWRNTDNPYVIWVTEVVFQQTRIDQGLEYFNRIIEKFPSVHDLAACDEEEILKMWQGLGYYSRARNLHFSAKLIVDEYDGIFPNKYKDILKLKGVGPYIAAEIASVCFGEVVAAVDGNVQRVVSRYFGVSDPVNIPVGVKAIQSLADAHIEKSRPGDFNQAMMDFGAMMCTPKNPKCDICMFNMDCYAFRNSLQQELPKKERKLKIKNRYLNFLIIRKGQSIYMQKRGAGDIWQGLYQPILIESKKKCESISDIKAEFGGYKLFSGTRKLTHQNLSLDFWIVESYEDTMIEDGYELIPYNSLSELPVPKSIEQLFLRQEFKSLFTAIE